MEIFVSKSGANNTKIIQIGPSFCVYITNLANEETQTSRAFTSTHVITQLNRLIFNLMYRSVSSITWVLITDFNHLLFFTKQSSSGRSQNFDMRCDNCTPILQFNYIFHKILIVDFQDSRSRFYKSEVKYLKYSRLTFLILYIYMR